MTGHYYWFDSYYSNNLKISDTYHNIEYALDNTGPKFNPNIYLFQEKGVWKFGDMTDIRTHYAPRSQIHNPLGKYIN